MINPGEGPGTPGNVPFCTGGIGLPGGRATPTAPPPKKNHKENMVINTLKHIWD
jgi:hypothetical protein